MPRDKFILAAQGILAVYVVYQMTAIVYNHLKAKDRLKRTYMQIFPFFFS